MTYLRGIFDLVGGLLNSLLLMFDAGNQWERLMLIQRGPLYAFFVHLLPLMALCLGFECWAMLKWGERPKIVAAAMIPVTRPQVEKYAVTQAAGYLVVVLVGAVVLGRVSKSFSGFTGFKEALTAMCYGISPLLLFHLLDGHPIIDTWICFGLGVAASMMTMYQGIPRMMKPDVAKALGLFFSGAVVFLVLALLAHLLAVNVLREEFNPNFWRLPQAE